MALLLKSGAIFLHIPKTGGTWVRRVLDELGEVRAHVSTKHADLEHVVHCGRHFPLRHLEKILRYGPGWNARVRRAYKFCFVRHPLTWYESWWKYMSHRGWHGWGAWKGRRQWHPVEALDGLGAPDFNAFVANVCAKEPGFVTRLYDAYARTDGAGFVGKMESLASDLGHVLDTLGIAHDPAVLRSPRANVSPDAVGPLVWDPDVRREAARLERPGIERYGYDEA